MAIHKLTVRKLASLSKPGKYGDGNGLYLYVSKNLASSWVFRYQIKGVKHYIGLGGSHAVNIKEAREKVRRARALLAQGTDPLQALRSTSAMQGQVANPASGNKTFDECASEYIAAHKGAWRDDRHAAQWANSIKTYASPYFGKMPVSRITTPIVLQALVAIWNTKTETASRLRGRIERVLSFATVRGYRRGENPARWDGHLQELLPRPSRIKRVRHYPSMPYWEVGLFFGQLCLSVDIGAMALGFTILTASRTSESLYARWQEIDFEGRVWRIPGERMKNGRPHSVPLADATLSILRRQFGLHPEWIFPGVGRSRPLHSSSMLSVLARMGLRGVTVHGFRSSFRVWAAEKTAYPREVVEMALAHRQTSATEEAYQRSDLFERRRELMRDWAKWCIAAKT
ncbi:MAG: tyrosine-type recombinase/integrase [Azoarcus sp.]|nr:tyrosine-type recombinase/integrase [Azoarcus sp.]